MSVFDRGPQRSGERNWRVQVETVDRGPAAGAFFSLQRRAKLGVRERLVAKVESPQKIILGTWSGDRRRFLAVNKEHVVAFAPPSVLVLQDRHAYADKVPAPLGLHPDVVVLAVHILSVFHNLVAVGLPLTCPATIG